MLNNFAIYWEKKKLKTINLNTEWFHRIYSAWLCIRIVIFKTIYSYWNAESISKLRSIAQQWTFIIINSNASRYGMLNSFLLNSIFSLPISLSLSGHLFEYILSAISASSFFFIHFIHCEMVNTERFSLLEHPYNILYLLLSIHSNYAALIPFHWKIKHSRNHSNFQLIYQT